MAATKILDLRAMLRQFGVVTVMDVDVYEAKRYTDLTGAPASAEIGEWDSKSTFFDKEVGGNYTKKEPLFSLRTLKIANINTEGPTKTATGGQNADVLLKYGKTFTIEMQDALGKYDVLEHVYGATSNVANYIQAGGDQYKAASVVAITDRFPGELTLVGKTFVIDKETGAKQPIYIVIPFYLGDGIFNLTQDAEGDISVFDLNGNILRFSNARVADTIDVIGTEYGAMYNKGADNQYYFFATEEAIGSLLAAEPKAYEELWESAPVTYKWVDPAGNENPISISDFPVTVQTILDFYKESSFANKIELQAEGQLVKADFDDNNVTILYAKERGA